jgi:hypothetical protein
VLRSHHVTITLLPLSPNVSICSSCDSASVELLRFILSPKVLPQSVDYLMITCPFLAGVSLSIIPANHVFVTSRDKTGALLLKLRQLSEKEPLSGLSGHKLL